MTPRNAYDQLVLRNVLRWGQSVKTNFNHGRIAQRLTTNFKARKQYSIQYIAFQSSAHSYLAKQYGIHFVIFILNDWHLLSHWNIIGERQKLNKPCNETFITKPHIFSIGKLPNVTTVNTAVKYTAKFCKSKSIYTPAHVDTSYMLC